MESSVSAITTYLVAIALPLTLVCVMANRTRAIQVIMYICAVVTVTSLAGVFFVTVLYPALNGTSYQFGFVDDDYRFDSVAIKASTSSIDWSSRRNLVDAEFSDYGLPHPAHNYPTLLSYWYSALGQVGMHPTAGTARVLNALALSGCALLTYGLASLMSMTPSYCRLATLFALLNPVVLANAVNIYRDTLILLAILAHCVAGAVLVSHVHQAKRSAVGILGTVALLSVLTLMCNGIRSHLGTLLLVTLMVVLLWRISRRDVLNSALARMCFWMAVLAAFFFFGDLYLLGAEITLSTRERFDDRFASSELSGFYGTMSAIDGVLAVPTRFALRSVLPLPVLVADTNPLLPSYWSKGSTFVWMLFLPLMMIGVWGSVRRLLTVGDGVPIVVSAYMSVLYATSALTTFQDRHVAMYLPLGILVGWYGFRMRRGREALLLGFWLAGMLIMVALGRSAVSTI